MLNLPRGPRPSLAARHRHQHARPFGNVLGREIRRKRDARAGREDDSVRLNFTEHPGEDCGSAHAQPVLRGSADLSTCHRPAHATWKRNVRPPSSPTSCSGSFGQMVASQPSHSLCAVPWPTPDVLRGATFATLGRCRTRACLGCAVPLGPCGMVLSPRRERRLRRSSSGRIR